MTEQTAPGIQAVEGTSESAPQAVGQPPAQPDVTQSPPEGQPTVPPPSAPAGSDHPFGTPAPKRSLPNFVKKTWVAGTAAFLGVGAGIGIGFGVWGGSGLDISAVHRSVNWQQGPGPYSRFGPGGGPMSGGFMERGGDGFGPFGSQGQGPSSASSGSSPAPSGAPVPMFGGSSSGGTATAPATSPAPNGTSSTPVAPPMP
ncbi:MAG TPA: hypothetical protein VMU77_04890 [Acidimicrobiales bacterium]|nr:hypothetical protein [Acidimicrobiales bacterium]